MELPTLHTARLGLRPLTVEAVEALIARDADALLALTGAVFPSPAEAPPLLEDALPWVVEQLRASPGTEVWHSWLMTLRETREAVGIMGLAGGPNEEGTSLSGWTVYPRFERQGYATEAMAALLGWAFEQPGLASVRATIPPWNTPSLRVAEKLGMRRIGTETDDEVGEVWVYEVRRSGGEGLG